MEEIKNRVANSALITLDLDSFLPEFEVAEIDIADFLFQGMILREKDFRTALKEMDPDPFSGKVISIHSSVDAIIPVWAYMLISTRFGKSALAVYAANPESAKLQYLLDFIKDSDFANYQDAKVVIKGCSEVSEKEKLYSAISFRLLPLVSSLMYGEPCSTIPIYKKPKG